MKFNRVSIENRIKSILIDIIKRVKITHKLSCAGNTFYVNDNVSLNVWQREPQTIKWIEAMGKDDVVFDIGANVGFFTMIMSKFAKKVFAFAQTIWRPSDIHHVVR